MEVVLFCELIDLCSYCSLNSVIITVHSLIIVCDRSSYHYLICLYCISVSYTALSTIASSTQSTFQRTMSLAPSIFDLPHLSHPINSHPSPTLDEQFETESLISDLLKLTSPPSTENGTGTVLRKGDHVKYVCSTMNYLAAPYVALDASRPWLLFWTMHSLDLLGCALDDETKKR